MTTAMKNSYSRIFITKFQSAPDHQPQFLTWAIPLSPEQNFGDVTKQEAPDPTGYDRFEEIGEVEGSEERPTIGVRMIYSLDKSTLLDLAKRRCAFDMQIHIGQCKDPRNFDAGWEKILAFEGARISTWSADDLGAMQSGDRAVVNEEADLSGRTMYEIMPLTPAERAKASVLNEVKKVLVCDQAGCGGDCGDVSSGCEKIFAVTAPAGSSPGMLPQVVYSSDGLSTDGAVTISSMAIGEDPEDAACVGDYLVVIEQTSLKLHYAETADILAGAPTWAGVTTGFVAAKGPRAIDSYSPNDTLIVGAGGYIYDLGSNPGDGVTVLDAGVATTQNLNDVFMFGVLDAVAVGDSNAVVYTTDGGLTWGSVTGPEVAANLRTVSMRSKNEWWVGTSTGKTWFTTDAGVSWTQKAFSGSGAGTVDDIQWASNMVGFMAHNLTGPARGRVFRTINGGYTWYLAPEGTKVLPANDKINSLAICDREVNAVYAAGLADNAADGIIIKMI